MELAFIKDNDSPNKRVKTGQSFTGFVSFISGVISLAGLNINLFLNSSFFVSQELYIIPAVGLVFGVVGLITRRYRMYAWWGIGLNSFIFIFTFLTMGLAWTINPSI